MPGVTDYLSQTRHIPADVMYKSQSGGRLMGKKVKRKVLEMNGRLPPSMQSSDPCEVSRSNVSLIHIFVSSYLSSLPVPHRHVQINPSRNFPRAVGKASHEPLTR